MAHYVVENQTAKSPPTASHGTIYVIGSAATGDWAGHDGKYAIGQTSDDDSTNAFYVRSPAEGDTIYDKALDAHFSYDGSAFVATASEWVYDSSRTAYLSVFHIGPDTLAYNATGLTAVTSLRTCNGTNSSTAPLTIVRKARLVAIGGHISGTVTNTNFEIIKGASTVIHTENVASTGAFYNDSLNDVLVAGDTLWARVDPTPGSDSVALPRLDMYWKWEKP